MIEAIAGVNALKRRARELGLHASNGDEKRPVEEFSDSDDDDDDAHTEFVPLMVANEKQDALEKKLRAKTHEARFHFDLSKKVRAERERERERVGCEKDLAADSSDLQMELAEMAELLFSHRGIVAFYACITVYLYGDLAIYAVAVPKSLREIICPRPSADAVVWECSDKFNSSDLYRLFVVLFGLLLGPFTFGHVHKTRTLQLVSTVIRHASFGLMIVLAIIGIARGHGRSVADVVSYEKPANVATFFGVCIYSFMCHHRYAALTANHTRELKIANRPALRVCGSVPGLVAPITDKSKVGVVLASAFMAVLSVYFVLCASATFRFLPEDVECEFPAYLHHAPREHPSPGVEHGRVDANERHHRLHRAVRLSGEQHVRAGGASAAARGGVLHRGCVHAGGFHGRIRRFGHSVDRPYVPRLLPAASANAGVEADAPDGGGRDAPGHPGGARQQEPLREPVRAPSVAVHGARVLAGLGRADHHHARHALSARQ
ncbi:hypothetical protein ON010_g8012 [Phytophthora cinnamomi]|nr:hypothetical protein ON010_g8012 [Phytophthora cinnamomi]